MAVVTAELLVSNAAAQGVLQRLLLLYEPRPSQAELRVPLLVSQSGPAVLGSNDCLFDSLTACSLLYFEKRP